MSRVTESKFQIMNYLHIIIISSVSALLINGDKTPLGRATKLLAQMNITEKITMM